MSYGISLYGAHASLDCATGIGTADALGELLGVANSGSIPDYAGGQAGIHGTVDGSFEEFTARLEGAIGTRARARRHSHAFGHIAIVAGGGGLTTWLEEARALGADTYVTGEGSMFTDLYARGQPQSGPRDPLRNGGARDQEVGGRAQPPIGSGLVPPGDPPEPVKGHRGPGDRISHDDSASGTRRVEPSRPGPFRRRFCDRGLVDSRGGPSNGVRRVRCWGDAPVLRTGTPFGMARPRIRSGRVWPPRHMAFSRGLGPSG